MNDKDIIVLYDDEGNEYRFEFLKIMEYDGNWFEILRPAELSEAEIFQVVYTDNTKEEIYIRVENENILHALIGILMEMVKKHYMPASFLRSIKFPEPGSEKILKRNVKPVYDEHILDIEAMLEKSFNSPGDREASENE